MQGVRAVGSKGRVLAVVALAGLVATATLVESGFCQAVLWVVPENHRARQLYESEGWSTDGAERQQEVLGVTINEIRYRRDLS